MKFSRPCPACGHSVSNWEMLPTLYRYHLQCPKCHKVYWAQAWRKGIIIVEAISLVIILIVLFTLQFVNILNPLEVIILLIPIILVFEIVYRFILTLFIFDNVTLIETKWKPAYPLLYNLFKDNPKE